MSSIVLSLTWWTAGLSRTPSSNLVRVRIFQTTWLRCAGVKNVSRSLIMKLKFVKTQNYSVAVLNYIFISHTCISKFDRKFFFDQDWCFWTVMMTSKCHTMNIFLTEEYRLYLLSHHLNLTLGFANEFEGSRPSLNMQSSILPFSAMFILHNVIHVINFNLFTGLLLPDYLYLFSIEHRQ